MKKITKLSIGKNELLKGREGFVYPFDKKILSTITRRNIEVLERAGWKFTNIIVSPVGTRDANSYLLSGTDSSGTKIVYARIESSSPASGQTKIYYENKPIAKASDIVLDIKEKQLLQDIINNKIQLVPIDYSVYNNYLEDKQVIEELCFYFYYNCKSILGYKGYYTGIIDNKHCLIRLDRSYFNLYKHEIILYEDGSRGAMSDLPEINMTDIIEKSYREENPFFIKLLVNTAF